jgi:hypothetical protein
MISGYCTFYSSLKFIVFKKESNWLFFLLKLFLAGKKAGGNRSTPKKTPVKAGSDLKKKASSSPTPKNKESPVKQTAEVKTTGITVLAYVPGTKEVLLDICRFHKITLFVTPLSGKPFLYAAFLRT